MNYLERRKKIFKVIRDVREKTPFSMTFGSSRPVRCKVCKKPRDEAAQALAICPHCGAHFPLAARARLEWLLTDCAWHSFPATHCDPLAFPGYAQKHAAAVQKSGADEAVLVATGHIGDERCVAFAMEPAFLMGSMGLLAGSRIAYAFDLARRERLPVVGFCASGGARMQEGVFSLMQMANTTMAVRAHHEAGLFYTAVLTDPTTGGVSASFANLADVILAEPGARICFTGRRVIEETIKEQLPEDFQTAEFLLEHGFVDAIVPRARQRLYLETLLSYHR